MKLCVIPVREGSKGLVGKNIRPFLGRPLLAHSVSQALASGVFDAVAVSSDSHEYLEIARAAGATCLIERPAELASDTATSLDALRHAVACAERSLSVEGATVTLLQATSPVREPRHIVDALRSLEAASAAENLVSVTATKDGPWSTLVVDHGGWARRLPSVEAEVTRRQDASALFRINGSIYVWRRTALGSSERLIGQRTLLYEMPQLYSFDIDTLDDLRIAEFAATELLGWGSAREASRLS